MWNSDHYIPDTNVFNNLLGVFYSQIAKASNALFFLWHPVIGTLRHWIDFCTTQGELHFFFSKSPVFLRDLTRHCSLLRFCIHSDAVIKYSKNKSNIKDMYLSFAHDCNSFVKWFWISNQISQTWCTPDRYNALQSKQRGWKKIQRGGKIWQLRQKQDERERLNS